MLKKKDVLCNNLCCSYSFIISSLQFSSCFCITAPTFKKEDVVRSLLLCISNDIGQIAYLQAKIHNVKKIYFGGFFIRGHPFTMHTITFAINFWSKVIKCLNFLVS